MQNKRLQAIADLIPHGSIVADIGTDHGYLPIELIERGTCERCYAADIAERPLESAKKAISSAHLEKKIATILCPGIQAIPADANVCVIAGMGWMTAQMILENDFNKLAQFDLILIQVNRDVHFLRRWIHSHKFKIVVEKVVKDRFFYEIVGFRPSIDLQNYTEEELVFGPLLMNSSDLIHGEYWQAQIHHKKAILNKLDPQTEKAVMLHKQIVVLSHLLSKENDEK